jgi:hypothetical protein
MATLGGDQIQGVIEITPSKTSIDSVLEVIR